MKVSGGERAVLVLTAVLLALMGGYFVGTERTRPLETVQTLPPAAVQSEPSAGADEAQAVPGGEQGALVDINTAGLEELMTLPGIGEKRARAILAYREEHGPFRYVEDLIQVSGIGESLLEGLLERATAGGNEHVENIGGG